MLYYFVLIFFKINSDDNKVESILRSMLNYFVIIICAISMILCSRAIFRAQLLKYVSMDVILYLKGFNLLSFTNLCYSITGNY